MNYKNFAKELGVFAFKGAIGGVLVKIGITLGKIGYKMYKEG